MCTCVAAAFEAVGWCSPMARPAWSSVSRRSRNRVCPAFKELAPAPPSPEALAPPFDAAAVFFVLATIPAHKDDQTRIREASPRLPLRGKSSALQQRKHVHVHA